MIGDIFYINYNDKVEIDRDVVLVNAWNRYIKFYKEGERISLNNERFFKNSFKSAYDAACAVSYGEWKCTDRFVCFNSEGFLTSFSHWDEERSPIDIDKIDISNLISLKK